MEDNNQSEINDPTNLRVTEEMRSYIYDMARWASFLAIVGFIFSGITIIGAFTFGASMDSNPQLAGMLGKMGTAGKIFFTVINLVIAFSIFYPSLLLFKYSAKAKQGVLYGEQSSLDEAFSKMKSLFSYWGILTILFIGIYVLLIISTVMAGLAAR